MLVLLLDLRRSRNRRGAVGGVAGSASFDSRSTDVSRSENVVCCRLAVGEVDETGRFFGTNTGGTVASGGGKNILLGVVDVEAAYSSHPAASFASWGGTARV